MSKTVRNISIATGIIALLLTAKKAVSSFSNGLSFNLPINKLGWDSNLIRTNIQPTLVVKNQGFMAGTLEAVNATIKLNRGNGNKVTLATTNPSTKKYELKSSQVHEFRLPVIEVRHFNLLTIAKTFIDAVKSQSGLIEIEVSGYANGVPFTTIQTY